MHCDSEGPSSSSLERITKKEKRSIHILQITDLRIFPCGFQTSKEVLQYVISKYTAQTSQDLHAWNCIKHCSASLQTLFISDPQNYLAIK